MVHKRLIAACAVAAIGTVAAIALGAHGWVALALFFAGLAALSANLLRLVEMGRTRLLNTGAALAHIGFALMFLGIVGSSFWGVGEEVQLPQGRTVEAVGRGLTYLGHVDGSEPEDRWRIRIQQPGREPVTAEVAMYRTGSARDSQILHKPAILRGLTRDLYIAPAGLETAGGHRELELFKGRPVRVGDTEVTFLRFETRGMGREGGMMVWAHVAIARGAARETLRLPYAMVDGSARSEPVRPTIDAGVSSLQLQRMAVDQAMIHVHVDLSAGDAVPVFHATISTKPLIGLLWAGTILLGLGCSVAWARRWVDHRAFCRASAEAEQASPKQRPRVRNKKKPRGRPTPRPAHARQA